MWTVVKVQGTEILHAVLDQWQAGINAHDPHKVAAAFTDDAIFQGLRPYSVGRDGVAAYYGSQPAGMTVSYQVLEMRRPTDELVLGYVRAEFAYPDRPTVPLHIGVVATHTDAGWRILHYQASPVAEAAR
jgi:uncharacterized protein (TIGR02246 family)